MKLILIPILIGSLAQYLFFKWLKRRQHHYNIINRHYAIIALPVLFLFFSFTAKNQSRIAYLVTVSRVTPHKFSVHKFTTPAQVDSVVKWNFGTAMQFFDAGKLLEHTNHFELITDDISIYCEKKNIAGQKHNGELKLKKIR